MNYVGPFIHRRDDIYEVEIFNHIYQVGIKSVDMKRDYDGKLELVVKMEKTKQSPIRGIDFIEKEIEKPFVNFTEAPLHEFENKIKLSNAPYKLNEDGTIKITGFSTEPLELLDFPSLEKLKEHHRNLSILMYNKIPIMRGTMELIEDIKNYGKSKNHIPDNVFFNDKKKATTLMFGKEATVVKCGKDDEYSRRIGFLEAYFQATCGLSKTKAKKYLENIVKDKEDK